MCVHTFQQFQSLEEVKCFCLSWTAYIGLVSSVPYFFDSDVSIPEAHFLFVSNDIFVTLTLVTISLF
jgi:hypothetical protein